METLKVFITGAGGFMGSHLVDMLHSKGHEVSGIYFGKVDLTAEIKNKDGLVKCDIINRNKVREIIAKIKPSQIYHLAAQSYPTTSWTQPHYTIETNILGTINVFEAVKELKLNCRILNAGSSAEYGFVKPEEVPVKESHELKPLHPYGISKVAQDLLAYQYHKNFGIDSVTMRIFNTTGPRKTNDVCSDFTRQLAAIKSGLQKPVIRVGNLGTKRAITDVRDVLNGFYLAMEKAESGESYNISGSTAYLIKDMLEKAVDLSGVHPEIFADKTLFRPTDEYVIFGDSTKFISKTGWKQEIPIEKTLEDMLNYWKEKQSAKAPTQHP